MPDVASFSGFSTREEFIQRVERAVRGKKGRLKAIGHYEGARPCWEARRLLAEIEILTEVVEILELHLVGDE